MASISVLSFSAHSSPSSPSSYTSSSLCPLQLQFPCIKFQTQFKNSSVSSVVKFNEQRYLKPTKVRAVAEEKEEIFVTEEETSTPADATVPDQTVSVAVSPSDVLTLFFQLTKQTTVQATGLASNLVELIKGSGFKLQTLNLSFQDEEDFSKISYTLRDVRVSAFVSCPSFESFEHDWIYLTHHW